MPQTGAIATNGAPLELGVQNGFPAEFFGGSADDFRIWNVARTQAQIQSDMNKELNPLTQTGLVSYYTANKGISAGDNTGLLTLIDQTGVNNGILDGYALNGAASNFIAQNSSVTTLPVRWLNFTVQSQNEKNALLSWSTASEHNSLDFIVQRSSNGNDWQMIGTLKAAGNSDQVNNYSFSDLSELNGLYYYRILKRDIDGRSNYSIVRNILFDRSHSSFQILGNPVANNRLSIRINEPRVTLSMYKYDGTFILKKQLSAGIATIDLSNFVKGVYLIKTETQTGRIVLQ